ncbi:MAG: T9SS type A sorting domain-containing protein [Bacteroidetes bacterium]|nr:T9SS type A sorting domain-containing protein [Bacteroidota bacterium]
MKYSIYFAIALILLINTQLSGQITFQKTYGGILQDYGNDVKQTTDGGYIIGGSTKSFGSGNFDMYLIKTNAFGEIIWTKVYGSASDERIKSIIQTADGGYAFTGFNDYDTYVTKTNANGVVQWIKDFGFTSGSGGNSIQQTSDGGFIVTGSTVLSGSNYDVNLIKLDSVGNLQWNRSYGGTFADISTVRPTRDKGFIIAGSYTRGYLNYDMYLIKTDSLGDTLWTKSYGGGNHDLGYSVIQTDDGHFILAGSSLSFGSAPICLTMVDSLGMIIWSKSYVGSALNNPSSETISIERTNDGCYVVFAEYLASDDLYLIKIDSMGNTLWTKHYGGINLEYMGSGQQTNDGGFILTGTTISFGAGAYDVYLIKTDSMGDSGCNYTSLANSPSIPAIQPFNIATIVTTPTLNNTPVVYPDGSGGTVTNICTSVGIESPVNDQLQETVVYPSPSNGNFVLEFTVTILKGNVMIHNLIGENIFETTILNATRLEVHLDQISSGIYFVKVYNGVKYDCLKISINKS